MNRESVLHGMRAAVLAAMSGYLAARGDRLPLPAWTRPAAVACAVAALWPVAAILAKRARRRDPPLDDLPSRDGHAFVGRGYAWTPACAREIRDAATDGRTFASPGSRELFVPDAELDKHMLILGTTGSGKSRLLEILAMQAIRRGDATAVIDPKGDERLLARVAEECARAGRTLDLVALPYPSASTPYNPLARHVEVREVADRIAALLPAGGDAEPFRNFAWEVAHATAAGLALAGEPLTLASMRRFAIDEPWELVKRATKAVDASALRGRDVKKAAELAARSSPELAGLVALASRPVEHTQKMMSALVPLLSKLTSGSNRALLSPERGGFDWERLDVAYFFLGSLLGADSASAVARMALLDFQSYVGRRYAYGGAARPVSLLVDELADVVCAPFVSLLNKSRGAGVRIAMAAQTLADLEAALGTEARARQVVGNVNTVAQFRAQSTADADAFSELAGRRLLPSASEGEAYEPSLFTSGFESVEDFRAIFSRQRAWRDEAFVPPWAVMDLAPLEFFARWGARTVRGAAPLLPSPGPGFVEELKRHAQVGARVVGAAGAGDRRVVGDVARTGSRA